MSMLTEDDRRAQENTSTSAGGAMEASQPVKYHVIALGSAFEVGTASSITRHAEEWERFEFESQHTTSGYTFEQQREPQDTGSAILELRRLTGFTWDQLARLFKVGRRSLHFWASGKPLNAANEEKLYRTLAVVRAIDRGSASKNRSLLLRERKGQIPLDLLADSRFDEVVGLVGKGPGREQPDRLPLSPEASAIRTPLSPEVLVDARQDTAHRELGTGRAARTVKARRRGRG